MSFDKFENDQVLAPKSCFSFTLKILSRKIWKARVQSNTRLQEGAVTKRSSVCDSTPAQHVIPQNAPMGLSLAIDNGLVSAFYFIFLDIILLTCLDGALSRLLSHYYYRQIFEGDALWLRSADIPGVTSFIVGRRFSPVNLAALATKAFFIGIVFLLDLNIFAEPSNPSVRLLSTFDLDSPMIPKNETAIFYNQVYRPWERTVSCYRLPRTTTPVNNSIAFYHVGFNLTNGNEFLQDDVQPVPASQLRVVYVNHTTMTCLSPNNVRHPKPLISVLGCSSLGRDTGSSCNTPANVVRTARFMRSRNKGNPEPYVVSLPNYITPDNYTFAVGQFNAQDVNTTFPEYVGQNKQTTLFCFRNGYGGTTMKHSARRSKRWCLLKVIENGTTLFERWDYAWQDETLRRLFAGPIFDAVLDIQLNRLLYYGQDVHPNSNWLDLSKKVLYHSMVYKFEDRTVRLLNGGSTRTVIPTFSVVLVAVFTVVICVLQITVRKFVVSHHPRLNNIDGISSIGREECKPSGKSLVKGSTMILGFSKIEGSVIHLGPLRGFESAVEMKKESEIV